MPICPKDSIQPVLLAGANPKCHDVRRAPPATVIETDAYLGEANGDDWTPEGFERAWKLSLQAFEDALRHPGAKRGLLVLGIPAAGKSTWVHSMKRPGDVILDEAKLVFPFRRQAALEVARRVGLPIEIIWVDTPMAECKDRNALRAPNRRVPENILQEARSLLLAEPPTVAEGFAKIRKVAGTAFIQRLSWDGTMRQNSQQGQAQGDQFSRHP